MLNADNFLKIVRESEGETLANKHGNGVHRMIELLSYLTPKEIQKLQEREAFHSSVQRIKASVKNGKRYKSLLHLSEKLGYEPYYLHQAFGENHMKNGRYYWTALFKALVLTQHKIPDALQARYSKWLMKQDDDYIPF